MAGVEEVVVCVSVEAGRCVVLSIAPSLDVFGGAKATCFCFEVFSEVAIRDLRFARLCSSGPFRVGGLIPHSSISLTHLSITAEVRGGRRAPWDGENHQLRWRQAPATALYVLPAVERKGFVPLSGFWKRRDPVLAAKRALALILPHHTSLLCLVHHPLTGACAWPTPLCRTLILNALGTDVTQELLGEDLSVGHAMSFSPHAHSEVSLLLLLLLLLLVTAEVVFVGGRCLHSVSR